MMYFGLAISGNMVNNLIQDNLDHNLKVRRLTFEEAEVEFCCASKGDQFSNCCNGSHVATLDALESLGFPAKIGLQERPPFASLAKGDSLLLMQVSGLPRLTDRHQYTAEEVANAKFTFQLWEVLD